MEQVWPRPQPPRAADPRWSLGSGFAISLIACLWGVFIPSFGGIILGAIGMTFSAAGFIRLRRGRRQLADGLPTLPVATDLPLTGPDGRPAQATIDLEPPRSAIGRVMKIYGFALGILLVAGVIGGIASHNSGLIVGALVASAVMILLILVEVPLITRAARRSAVSYARRAPGGIRYLGSGWLVDSQAVRGGARQLARRRGVLAVTDAGISLLPPDKPTSPYLAHAITTPLDLTWRTIAEVHAAPAPRAATYLLVLRLHDGTEITWLATLPERLYAALTEITARRAS